MAFDLVTTVLIKPPLLDCPFTCDCKEINARKEFNPPDSYDDKYSSSIIGLISSQLAGTLILKAMQIDALSLCDGQQYVVIVSDGLKVG